MFSFSTYTAYNADKICTQKKVAKATALAIKAEL